MKILVDCHSFDYDYFQGVTTYITGLYKDLINERKDIYFYFAAYNLNKIKEIFGAATNVFYLKLNYKSPLIRLTFELPFLVVKHKINYLHVQYKVPFFKFCKEIVTVHDVLFLDYPEYFNSKFIIINKIYYRFSSRRADILLTVSNYSKSRISSYFKIPESKIEITPNGVDEVFLNLSNNTNLLSDVKLKYGIDKYIIYVSRIEPRKNHDMVVNVFKELRLYEKGIKLVFVGAQTQKSVKLLDELKKVKYGSIMFLENISTKELASLYSNAMFSIYPSFAEGFGIPPIESVIMRTPVILSNTTAMKDLSILSDKMIDPYSIKDLKALMEIGSKGLFNFEEKHREIAIENYSWKQIALNFSKLIQI
jgi:glycosyltransferase involved in cell wall biosynthesis